MSECDWECHHRLCNTAAPSSRREHINMLPRCHPQCPTWTRWASFRSFTKKTQTWKEILNVSLNITKSFINNGLVEGRVLLCPSMIDCIIAEDHRLNYQNLMSPAWRGYAEKKSEFISIILTRNIIINIRKSNVMHLNAKGINNAYHCKSKTIIFPRLDNCKRCGCLSYDKYIKHFCGTLTFNYACT